MSLSVSFPPLNVPLAPRGDLVLLSHSPSAFNFDQYLPMQMVNGVAHNITWVSYNDASDPDLTAILAEYMIANNKPNAFITGQGTYSPNAFPFLEAVPVMNVGDFYSWQTEFSNVWSFVPLGPDDGCIRLFADLGPLRIGLIYTEQVETDYGLVTIAKDQANGTGLQFVYEAILAADWSNLDQVLAEARALQPPIDIIMGGGYEPDSEAVLNGIRDLDWPIKGIYMWLDQYDWRVQQGWKALNVFTEISWNANSNFTDPWWGNSRNFADAYRAATGTNATYIEAISVAGVQYLIAAIERAGSLVSDDIQSAVRALNGSDTVIGPARFLDGQGLLTPWRCFQVDPTAELREVSPASPALVFPAYVSAPPTHTTPKPQTSAQTQPHASHTDSSHRARWLGLGLGLGLGLLVLVAVVLLLAFTLRHFQVIFIPKGKTDEW